MIHDYTVLIPIAALLIIVAGLVHGIRHAYREGRARRDRERSTD